MGELSAQSDKLDAIPDDVRWVCRRLREHDKRAWIVGGCVRDLLRTQPAKDWDIATDARPDEVLRMFPKVIPTGLQHGTVTVLVHGRHYEVTTLRGEGAYSDGRHPDEVKFLDDIAEDLARRDFTVNAIAIDPIDGQVIDPFGGQRDLEARVLRAVGKPIDRFLEDGLRILRAARFAATLEHAIEPDTLRAMGEQAALANFARVSAERVHDEWVKAMAAPRPSVAFDVMQQTRMLDVHCPELREAVGCEQNRWHAYDVWRHTMAVLDACEPDAVLRIGALLHDVAKPRTRKRSPKSDDWTFYNHEVVGADMADAICKRLKFSNEDRERVVEIVRHHLVCYAPDWSDAAVRRWVRRVTVDRTNDLYRIAKADARGKGKPADADIAAMDELRERVERLLSEGTALSTRDLALDGNDLIAELGVTPGPIIGKILAELVEVVTDDPSANERTRLLSEARRILAERGDA